MRIANWIGGIIGLVLLFLFLGKYAVSINSVALWIIIVACLAMPVADFVQSLREDFENGNDTP